MPVVYMCEQRCFLAFGTHSCTDTCASECQCLKSHAGDTGCFFSSLSHLQIDFSCTQSSPSQQVYSVYPEIPFICIPSAKITDSSKACAVFFLHIQLYELCSLHQYGKYFILSNLPNAIFAVVAWFWLISFYPGKRKKKISMNLLIPQCH